MLFVTRVNYVALKMADKQEVKPGGRKKNKIRRRAEVNAVSSWDAAGLDMFGVCLIGIRMILCQMNI